MTQVAIKITKRAIQVTQVISKITQRVYSWLRELHKRRKTMARQLDGRQNGTETRQWRWMTLEGTVRRPGTLIKRQLPRLTKGKQAANRDVRYDRIYTKYIRLNTIDLLGDFTRPRSRATDREKGGKTRTINKRHEYPSRVFGTLIGS